MSTASYVLSIIRMLAKAIASRKHGYIATTPLTRVLPFGGQGIEALEPRLLLSNGLFAETDTFPIHSFGGSNAGIVTADVNGDGFLDFVTSDGPVGSATACVWQPDRSFDLVASETSLSQPRGLACGDLNHDGQIDLAVAGVAAMAVLHGSGDGHFSVAETTGGGGYDVAAGDFHLDGWTDLAVSGMGVLEGTASGFHLDSSVIPGDGYVVAADFNGDGLADLAGADRDAGTVRLFDADGGGGFDSAGSVLVGDRPVGITCGDFNGDGWLDLAVARSAASAVTVLHNQGGGGFQIAYSRDVGPSPWAVTCGDFNGDGRQDVATANIGGGSVSILVGQPNGELGQHVTEEVGPNPHCLAAGDFGNDGATDLVVYNSDGTVSVLYAVSSLPTVTSVAVAGSGWDQSFAGFLAAEGLGDGGYSIPVGSAVQLDELPWVNVDQIRIAFSKDVDVETEDLTVCGFDGQYAISGFGYDPVSHVATWALDSPVGADRLFVSLTDDVADSAGNALDGEWTDGVSTWPSGDGAAGGDFRFRLNVLPGDVDQSGVVRSSDTIKVRRKSNTQPGDPDYSVFYDIDGSGVIRSSDTIKVRRKSNTELPLDGPLLMAALAIDTGLSDADGITNDPTVTGTVTYPCQLTSLLAGLDAAPAMDVLPMLVGETLMLTLADLEAINGGPVGDGTHVLRLEAFDGQAGPCATADVPFTLDTTAPAVAVTDPQSQDVFGKPDISVQYTVDGSPHTQAVTLTDLENTIRVTGSDVAGNQGSAEIVVYYNPGTLVDPTAGAIVLSPTADGASVAVPVGGMAAAAEVSVTTLNADPFVASAPPGHELASVVTFLCDETFHTNIAITLPLGRTYVPGTQIELGLVDEATGHIQLTGKELVVNEDGTTASAEVSHFSSYAALKPVSTTGAAVGSAETPLPDLFTGTFSHTIPIELPRGRQDMTPKLDLVYRSSGGNSIVGYGWELTIPSIARTTKHGVPTYDNTDDVFVFSYMGQSTELVKVANPLQAMEGQIQGIAGLPESTAIEFTAVDGSQLVGVFDLDNDGLPDRVLHDPSDPSRWWWQRGTGTGLAPLALWADNIASIGGIGQMAALAYKTPEGSQIVGLFDIDGDDMLDRVLAEPSDPTKWWAQINTGSGFGAVQLWSDGIESLLPASPGAEAIAHTDLQGRQTVATFDTNGDGLPDRVLQDTANPQEWYRQLNTGNGFGPLIHWTTVSGDMKSIAYTTPDGARTVDVLDIDGDGLMDRVYRNEADHSQWMVQRNNGADLDSPTVWASNVDGLGNPARATAIAFAGADGRQTVGTFDINGDGLPDRVLVDESNPSSWWVQRNTGVGFADGALWADDIQGAVGVPGTTAIAFTTAAGAKVAGTFDVSGDGLPDRLVRNSVDHSQWMLQREDAGALYQAKIESSFHRFHLRANDTWHVVTKEGLELVFGASSQSKVAGGGGTFAWYITRATDANANYIVYDYSQDQGQVYPARIEYTGNEATGALPQYVVEFTTEPRLDVLSNWVPGACVTTAQRISGIEVRTGGSLARMYALAHTPGALTGRSLLTGVQTYGSDGTTEGLPTALTHHEGGPGFNLAQVWSNSIDIMDGELGGELGFRYAGLTYTDDGGQQRAGLLDVNGDGLPDRVLRDFDDPTRWLVQLNTGVLGDGFAPAQVWSSSIDIMDGELGFRYAGLGELGFRYAGLTYTDDGGQQRAGLLDVNGDGLPDRVLRDFDDPTRWLVQLNQASETIGSGSTNLPVGEIQIQADGEAVRTYGLAYEHGGAGGRSLLSRVQVYGSDGTTEGLPTDLTYHGRHGFADEDGWGNVFFRSSLTGSHALSFTDSAGAQTVGLVDLTGDGLPDRVLRDNSAPDNDRWLVQRNNGQGFEDEEEWGNIFFRSTLTGSHALSFTSPSGDQNVGLFDVTGDGLPDRVLVDNTAPDNDRWIVQPNQASEVIGSGSMCLPDTLIAVDNGLGAVTSVSYKPTTQLGIKGVHYPVFVVTQVEVTDTQPPDSDPEVYVQDFSYEGAYFDAGEREFRGFATVTVTDPITGNYTGTEFHQGGGDDPDALKGKTKSIRAFDGTGAPIFEETNTYRIAGLGPGNETVAHPMLTQVDTTVYENGSSVSVRTRYEYDGVGNVIREISDGDLSVAGDERTAVTDYAKAYGYGSQYNGVSRSELRNDLDELVRRTSYAYDGRGNLSQKTAWLATGDDPVTEYTYDDYGNRLTVIDALNRTTRTTYETTYHQYPETVTNELGHVTQYVYDARFGVVESQTDANGNTTSYSYDPLGRRLTVTDPYGRVVTTHSYPDFNTTVTTDFCGLTTTQYIDGLRRAYKSVRDGEDGAAARDGVTDKTYDERGHLASESVPHYVDADPATISYVRYTYDLRGRQVERLADYPGTADDAVTRTDYLGPLSTKVTDPEGHARTTVRDVYDNVVEVVDHTGSGDYHTIYFYDAANRLVRLTDDHGNVTSITYDSVGRKMMLDDPDTHVTTYSYDRVGNLITQTDAKGQVTTLTYDALNRVTVKAYTDPSTPPVTYVYDEPTAANGTGRLTTVHDGSGTATYQYDKLGRAVGATRTIDSTAYPTATTFDAIGRVETMTFPDGEVVSYGYDANSGLLESVTGSAGYVTDITYDAQSRKTGIAYGNGTRADYTYGSDQRLERILSTNTSTSAVLQDLLYDYDLSGNITQIDDAVYGYHKTFDYDDLDRLIQAEGFPNSPSLTWQYDAIGNMTFNSQVGSYAYGEGGAGPHAVTSAGGSAYAYDANGNMVSGPGRTLVYDQEDRLISSVVGGVAATYVYDHAGQRVKQTTQGVTTTYVSSAYEVETGAETHTARHIFAGGQRVASIRDGTASYYLPDHLGSSNLMTNDAGQVIQHTEYAPFGGIVEQTGQDVTDYQFTGKELDASGLYYYGARYYDPVLGRFITADTVVSKAHASQELNRYSYCANNPISRVDPTGHSWLDKIKSVVESVGDKMESAFRATVKKVKEAVKSVAGKAARAAGAMAGAVRGIVGSTAAMASRASTPAASMAKGAVASATTTAGGWLVGRTQTGLASFIGREDSRSPADSSSELSSLLQTGENILEFAYESEKAGWDHMWNEYDATKEQAQLIVMALPGIEELSAKAYAGLASLVAGPILYPAALVVGYKAPEAIVGTTIMSVNYRIGQLGYVREHFGQMLHT